jgi:hypothetical protein
LERDPSQEDPLESIDDCGVLEGMLSDTQAHPALS